MPKINKIDEFLNSNYHQDVALFPKKVKDKETDDFIAWKVGRVAVKASSNVVQKARASRFAEQVVRQCHSYHS